ncbi:protein naked cuticle homolog 2-like isoform X3 [Sphaeramia orbicularis]|uniref:protein naked cuticle homolog 2-like isoform X3 n=1 Tax=Sphaeramia orbicularis TaxID=375764 RepID=UPI00117D027B|nr:protein naked cuticle homolog 2-like isoform X3 [Sphaeramia orbicularis]
MGKLHSKLAPKRRQSPEGGILASIHTPRERPAENLFRELKETSPNNCDLKVTLPPERGSDYGSHLPEKKQSKKRDSHTADTEDIKHAEDPRQEWVFTLYNFDHSSKATKEDMSSLIHSMYEALEASVKQPSGGTTVLKFNLVMSPSLQDKVSQPVSAPNMRITSHSFHQRKSRVHFARQEVLKEDSTVQMKTSSAETIIWIWLVLKTTLPSLTLKNPHLRSPDTILFQLLSTTLCWQGRTTAPQSIPEVPLCFIPQRASHLTKKEGPPESTASTLLPGASLATLNTQSTALHNVHTAKGYDPENKKLSHLAPRPSQEETGRYQPNVIPPVVPLLFWPYDMITITTTSITTTIIITTTTQHECISDT